MKGTDVCCICSRKFGVCIKVCMYICLSFCFNRLSLYFFFPKFPLQYHDLYFIFLVQCNFGHCQTVFHPYCARNIGFYMHTKTNGGKLLHKAYCEKHSSEQRTKVKRQN